MCRKIRCDTLRWKFLGTKQSLTWIISPKALHSPQFGKVAAKHSPTSVSSQRFLQAALCVQNPGSNEWWPFRQDRSISNVVAIQTDHHKSTDLYSFPTGLLCLFPFGLHTCTPTFKKWESNTIILVLRKKVYIRVKDEPWSMQAQKFGSKKRKLVPDLMPGVFDLVRVWWEC